MSCLYCVVGIDVNKVINIMEREEIDQNDKIKSILLQLNQMGLSYLRQTDFQQAIAYFKKAEKIVVQQLMVSRQSLPINQMAAVTFNNIACYYKKTKKPKVALSYLKRSLQIQIHQLKDWISIASTHLNICAIHSYLAKHEQAVSHVELALAVLDRHSYEKEDKSEPAKCYWNIKMLCLYNKAIEQEHLKQFTLSLQTYQQAKQLAKLEPKKNISIILSCDQAITRMEDTFAIKKQRMIELFLKKREDEESGHYDFMRRNISRVRNEEDLSMGQYGTAQLIKRGDKIRLKRIHTHASNNNKQSLYELKHLSHHSTKVSNNRAQTQAQQTPIHHFY